MTAGKQPSTVLGWRQPVPTPLAEQLLVLGSHTSVQAHCSQEMVCTGPMASLSPHPRLERPSWGEAETGHTCGQAAGQHFQGCQVLGSLGAEALHNATALHAIKKEEVVVRRVSLRQGLGRKTRGFNSDAFKRLIWRKKEPSKTRSSKTQQRFSTEVDFAPQGLTGYV